jgi:hypothetical protein
LSNRFKCSSKSFGLELGNKRALMRDTKSILY